MLWYHSFQSAREPMSSYTHFLGVLLSLIGLPLSVLLYFVKGSGDPLHLLAALIFCCSTLALYTTSCVYHFSQGTPTHINHLRKLDHAMIYVLIAGSYTPMLMSFYPKKEALVSINKYFSTEPIIVTNDFDSGICLNMANPKELGADRLAKLAAGFEIYGGPVMVIDYGTATTFDVVDEKGVFVTGITAPGVNICAEALFTNTAQLPKIEIKRPGSIYCRDIVSCIQSGIYYGHVGEARYIIENVKKELNMPDMKVVATGGMAREIGNGNGIFDVLDPFLSFKGLFILYKRNIDNIRRREYAAGH